MSDGKSVTILSFEKNRFTNDLDIGKREFSTNTHLHVPFQFPIQLPLITFILVY